MKNKKLDKIVALMTIGLIFAFVGDIFFDYDSTRFLLSLIMLFCCDISTTLRRLHEKTLGDDD